MTGIESSDRESRIRPWLSVGIALFLISPFLVWLTAIDVSEWTRMDFLSAVSPLGNSFVQASLSTILTMAVGFALFIAFQSLKSERMKPWAESVLLMPNVIPPLFIALGLLTWTPLFGGAFPFGMGAVVMAHVLLNSGLVALSLDRMIKGRAMGVIEAGRVMGVPPVMFWRAVLWPLLRGDLMSLALFIFSLHFTSFSLPLLLSGERALTLEIAIFDAIRIQGRWDLAVLLALIQSAFIFALAWVLPRPFWPEMGHRPGIADLGFRLPPYLVFLPGLVLVMGWLHGLLVSVVTGWGQLVVPELIESTVTTIAIGLGVGIIHLLIFLWIAYVSPNFRLEKFLHGYLAPSAAITGFAMILIPVDDWEILKLVFALTLISVPLLYRWMVHSVLVSLEQQVALARTLGAGWMMILLDVVWPQAAPTLLRASGLAALWASGDFALSGIVLNDEITLPLLIEDYLNNYHFEAAQLLLIPLVAVGVGLYGFFRGAIRFVTG